MNRFERYILWLAPALVLQAVGHYFAGPGLEYMIKPAMIFLLLPSDVISAAAFLILLPTLVTATWIAIDSDSTAVVKVAWFVAGLSISFTVLIPYIGSLLICERSRQSEGKL